jgi:hypothetical protein
MGFATRHAGVFVANPMINWWGDMITAVGEAFRRSAPDHYVRIGPVSFPRSSDSERGYADAYQ